jgi:hypothetical protein
MPYLSIIRAAEQQGTPPQGLIDAIDQYVAKTLKDGTALSTGGLAPSSAAARVRIQSGRLKITDGPFTESKEVIGGCCGDRRGDPRRSDPRDHRVHAAPHRSLACLGGGVSCASWCSWPRDLAPDPTG